MGIRGYTKNYKLIKPEYDTDTWHDYEYDNLDTIDAVLSAIYASGDWQGFWKNNTSYKAGSVVIDKDTDTMYKVVADHTTDGNVTFAEYMFNHPEYYQLWSPNNLAKDWAIKDDGLADNQDYSAKAYAVGGVGTETNNAKYYSEQAGLSANISAEQAAASASSATASYNSEQLALSYANQSASSASASQTGAEQSTASAAISQEKAEYAADKVSGLEAFVQEKQNEISVSLAEAIKASEDAKKYAVEASGANIGDIFYTSRLDNELNGAVDADGAIYSVEAFTGEQSVPALLRKGSLPSVSMSEYESIISSNGSCRAWGWDGGDTFRVPLLKDVYLMAGQAETAGEFISESLPDHNHIEGFCGVNTFATYGVTNTAISGNVNQQSGSSTANHAYTSKASEYSSVYQNNAKVRPDSVRYRAMVQLTTGVKEDSTQLKEYKFNNPHFFGESMWTDIDPMNSSWLVSNGAYHSGRTHVGYYQWLASSLGKDRVKGMIGYAFKKQNEDIRWWTAKRNPEIGDVIFGGSGIQKIGVVNKVNLDGTIGFYEDAYSIQQDNLIYTESENINVDGTGFDNIVWASDYDWIINQNDQTFRLPLLNGSEDLPSSTVTIEDVTQSKTFTAEHNMYVSCNVNISGTGRLLLVMTNKTSGTKEYNEYNGAKEGAGCTLFAKKGDSVSYGFSTSGFTITQNKLILNKAVGNGTLYFYVGDTLQDPALINAGEALDYLSRLSTVHCVVETFKSGSSWYRVYDDGWVEQGGASNIPALGTTISFLKPFADTNYSLAFAGNDTSADAGIVAFCYRSRTAKSFVMDCGYNGSFYASSFSWIACGYGA